MNRFNREIFFFCFRFRHFERRLRRYYFDVCILFEIAFFRGRSFWNSRCENVASRFCYRRSWTWKNFQEPIWSKKNLLLTTFCQPKKHEWVVKAMIWKLEKKSKQFEFFERKKIFGFSIRWITQEKRFMFSFFSRNLKKKKIITRLANRRTKRKKILAAIIRSNAFFSAIATEPISADRGWISLIASISAAEKYRFVVRIVRSAD